MADQDGAQLFEGVFDDGFGSPVRAKSEQLFQEFHGPRSNADFHSLKATIVATVSNIRTL